MTSRATPRHRGHRASSPLLWYLAVVVAIGFLLPTQPARAQQTPPTRLVTTADGTCVISNNKTLRACADHAAAYRKLVFTADVASPASPASCGPGGAQAIIIRGLAGITIDGQGHTWRRAAPLACSAILIQQARGITVRDLNIVENPRIAPCALSRKQCPSTIEVESAAGVRLDGVRVYDGKGYVIRVWHTDRFTFTNGVMAGAGQIGLYVGHWKYGTSRNVTITHSVFARTRTNAVAVEGADGVTITANVFTSNHWHGLWPVPGAKGGITTGGQLLLADATNAKVTGNVFANGACGNCVPRGQAVLTIELGGGATDPGVRGLTIANNAVLNASGPAFHQNTGAHVTGVRIAGNRLRGDVVLDDIRAAMRSNNVITRPAAPRMGATTSTAFRIHLNGTLHTAAKPDAFPGGKIEAAFALSPAPVPGGPTAPLLRCTAGGADFPSSGAGCGGTGTPAALLGFAFPAGYPKTQPFFLCQATGHPAERFLSWDARCRGQTRLAPMGNAMERKP